VKRLCADDSAATSVKVGYRQANYSAEPAQLSLGGLFAFLRLFSTYICKIATKPYIGKVFAGAKRCAYGSISPLPSLPSL
ncbi:hypothetical protein ACI48D_08865, partial [Massilia sp. LXY-6]|uniref:hypothetical protein n=1 Tax=Massilia sp. LXY-6 TaxID=3379823 RepID=UPI003EE18311